jgi:spermidine synthase
VTRLVCLIFFLSGVAALVFEGLWFRQATLALGSTVWASSIVLASFMGGLALGNGVAARVGQRISRVLIAYALLELIVGITGLAVTLALPSLGSLLSGAFGALEGSGFQNSLRLLVALCCLIVPTTAMGMTLPLLTKALCAYDSNFGRVLGRLYGWNTSGAVVGALLGECVLIRAVGVRGTALCAMGLCLTVALVTYLLDRRWLSRETAPEATVDPPAQTPPSVVFTGPVLRILGAAFLCGACLLALEVLWFRLLLLFAFGTSLVFAILLAVVLAGIATGSFVASAWIRWKPSASEHAASLAALTGILAIVTYRTFEPSGIVDSPPSVAWLAALLMFPVSCCSGALFTLQGAALQKRIGEETRASGLLTLANTLGGLVGAALGGLVLIPTLGVERSYLLISAAYGVAALALWLPTPRTERAAVRLRVQRLGATLTLVGLALTFPLGRFVTHFTRVSEQAFVDVGETVVALHEGRYGTLRWSRRDFLGEPLFYRYITDSHSMSASRWQARRYMKLFVYLPVALHPRPKRALLIAFGVGGTAKALTDTAGLESIDVVDPSAATLAMSRLMFPKPGTSPLDDPRVRVHHEDGRFFLQTTDERYDLITGEPPPPTGAGIVNLYTKEYFELIFSHLNEGGFVSYWLPCHSLTEEHALAITRAFREVFSDATLWQGVQKDLVLLGSRGAKGPVSQEHFTAQWRDPRVLPELRAVGLETPEQLGTLFLRDATQLEEWVADVEPVLDDFPLRLSHFVDGFETQQWAKWIAPEAAQRAFEESRWIQEFWPPTLREATPAWFRHLLPPLCTGRPWASLAELHAVLNEPRLSALPLFILGSSVDRQRIVSRVSVQGDGPGRQDLAVQALVEGRFKPMATTYANVYGAYALCRMNELQRAAALVKTLRANTPSTALTADLDWLEATFTLGETGGE